MKSSGCALKVDRYMTKNNKDNVTQLSTHVKRKRTRWKKDPLEDWLRDWGKGRALPISELATPLKTSFKTIQELRPEKMEGQKRIPRYYKPNGDLYPMWVCKMLYELFHMWHKRTQESTRSIQGRVPRYMPNPRIATLNEMIGLLDTIHQGILALCYELKWNAARCHQELGMPESTYYDRLKKAKKELRRRLDEYQPLWYLYLE